MTFYESSAKERRQKILNRVIKSLEKNVPTDSITRYLVHEYGYSLSGANHIIKECRFRMEDPPKERLTWVSSPTGGLRANASAAWQQYRKIAIYATAARISISSALKGGMTNEAYNHSLRCLRPSLHKQGLPGRRTRLLHFMFERRGPYRVDGGKIMSKVVSINGVKYIDVGWPILIRKTPLRCHCGKRTCHKRTKRCKEAK